MEIFNGRDDERSLSVVFIKSFALLIPGAILGHYIDKYINRMKKKNVLGKEAWVYVLFQSIVDILLIYSLHKLHSLYTDEFQRTLPGLYFSGLFFGLQVNYINNVQEMFGGNN